MAGEGLDLEAIKARLAAITPGPWAAAAELHPKDHYWGRHVVFAVRRLPLPALVYTADDDAEHAAEAVERWDAANSLGNVCETHNYSSIPEEQHDANQRFIAHAPEDVAALVAHVEELRARDGG